MFLVTRPRSFWLKPKKKKKTEDHKIRDVDRRCHARNTRTLHLQTWLSGRRNFFTVIARRNKNFLLLRSWMEVDDRVSVSNHYSKKHDARHSCTFAKDLKTPQHPLARLRRKQASYTVWSLKTKSQDPFCWNHRAQTLLIVFKRLKDFFDLTLIVKKCLWNGGSQTRSEALRKWIQRWRRFAVNGIVSSSTLLIVMRSCFDKNIRICVWSGI